MMGNQYYEYGGDVFDAHEPLDGPEPPPAPREYIGFTSTRCGTLGGYNSHRKYGVPMCFSCNEASREYQRQRYLYSKANNSTSFA